MLWSFNEYFKVVYKKAHVVNTLVIEAFHAGVTMCHFAELSFLVFFEFIPPVEFVPVVPLLYVTY